MSGTLQPPPGIAGQLLTRAASDHREGRLAAAIEGYRQALSVAPFYLETRNLLALALLQSGDAAGALAMIDGALGQRSNVARWHETRGHALRELGEFDAAISAFRQAVRREPASAVMHHNLGWALQVSGRAEEAAASYRRALRRDASLIMAHNNLAMILTAEGRHAEAEAAYREAIRLRPGEVEPLVNLASLLANGGRRGEARQILTAALALASGHERARDELAAIDLVEGAVARGLAVLRRFGAPDNLPPVHAEPRWNGETESDETILIHPDQGQGEFLLCCRFIPEVARRVRVMLETPPPLMRLMRSLPADIELVEAGLTPAGFHRATPITCLPAILGVDLATIPADVPYLRADAAEVEAWRGRIADLPGRRVGLVWAGAAGEPFDAAASLPPARLDMLADIPGISFVSLQSVFKDGSPVPFQVRDMTDDLNDMAATAALITALDLVLGVDTGIIQLAGALGRPVWMMNRFDTDWRWFLDRNDSPWYPTMRIFRQPGRGQWEPVLREVRASLEAFADGA